MDDLADINIRNLLENAHIGVVIHRWDTSIVYANPTALKLLRLELNQIIGKDAYDTSWRFVDDAGKRLKQEDFPVHRVRDTKKRLSNYILGVADSSNDRITWLNVNAYWEGDEKIENRMIIVSFTDITNLKQVFSYKDVLENTQDIVIVTEADDVEYPSGPKIVYVNRAFETLTGYSQEEIIGETPRILQGTLTDKSARGRIYEALKDYKQINETLLNYDKQGRPYWIQMDIFPLKNKYGEVTHFAAIERDVSIQKFHTEQLEKRNQDLKALKNNLEKLVDSRTNELQEAKNRIEKIAYLDPLTEIPNRRYFTEHAERLIKFSARRKLSTAIGIIDLDDFKSLNDKYGHHIGDVILQGFACFLESFFRADDVICRYGGEEFAFILALNEDTKVCSLVERLLQGVRDLQFPSPKDEMLGITVSIGIKLYKTPKIANLELGLHEADLALYEAKNSGKDKAVFVKS